MNPPAETRNNCLKCPAIIVQGSFLSFIYNPHFKYGFIFIEFFTGILNDLSWYMALHIHRRDHGFESSGSQKIQAPLVASEWFMCLYNRQLLDLSRENHCSRSYSYLISSFPSSSSYPLYIKSMTL